MKMYFTNTSHTQKGVKSSVYNRFGINNTIMLLTTASRRSLRALSDSLADC